MKYEAVLSSISLSRGSGWHYELRGKPGDYWPDSGQVFIVFYESTGAVIATLDGTMTSRSLLFDYEPTDVALIPHGAGYEIFVTPDDTGVPIMVRYGVVTRREVTFPDAPAIDLSDTAMYYGDNFERKYLGPRWVVKYGKPQMSGGKISATQQALALNTEKAGLLYYAPLNGDDCTINVKFDIVNDGAAAMIYCSDYNMTSYLGFAVEKGTTLWSHTSKVHIIRGTGPGDHDKVQSVTYNTTDSSNFVIKYNSQTKTSSVYVNDGSSPLIQWTETAPNTVPHGEGYRYLGMHFWTGNLLSYGPRIDKWSGKDGI